MRRAVLEEEDVDYIKQLHHPFVQVQILAALEEVCVRAPVAPHHRHLLWLGLRHEH